MSAHPSVLLRDFSKLVVLFALTGCTGPNPPPPPPATINVSGTVLLVGNAPLVGAEVFLEDSTGLRGPVTTAASGSFVFADVSTPYTLSVVPPAASEARRNNCRAPAEDMGIGDSRSRRPRSHRRRRRDISPLRSATRRHSDAADRCQYG